MILLVEDNPDDEVLTLRALRKNGIPEDEVTVAREGEQAVAFLLGIGEFASRVGQPLPRLVLLDLNLPRMNGLDVLRRVRSEPQTKLVPIVVLTSSREEEDIRRSYTLGANAYVRKPVDFSEFIGAVKTLGHFWLDANRAPPGRIGQ